MREKPLLPWVICEASGKVVIGHCNSMAGLGETCSHVASLLWAIQAGIHLRESMTVTQKKAYWVLPPSVKDVPYAPLGHINFMGTAGSLTTLRSPSLAMSSPLSLTPPPSLITSPPPRKPSSSVMSNLLHCRNFFFFFANLAECSTKPAILTLVKEYSSKYIPSLLAADLPPCLSDAYKTENLQKSFTDLLQIAGKIYRGFSY